MRSWKTLSRTLLLNHSKYLVVENHTVELPDGQTISDWPWVKTPDFVIVCAVTAEQRFVCLRQTKYGIEGTSLAPIGGYIEPGEDPLPAAQRELLEEAGYQAERWISLGEYTVDGNRGAGTAHLFLALEATCVAVPDADDLEEQELLFLSQDAIETALLAGQFKVLPWAAVMALALVKLDKLSLD
jgi:ADP-ribose pyrophosphatase